MYCVPVITCEVSGTHLWSVSIAPRQIVAPSETGKHLSVAVRAVSFLGQQKSAARPHEALRYLPVQTQGQYSSFATRGRPAPLWRAVVRRGWANSLPMLPSRVRKMSFFT